MRSGLLATPDANADDVLWLVSSQASHCTVNHLLLLLVGAVAGCLAGLVDANSFTQSLARGRITIWFTRALSTRSAGLPLYR